MPELWTVRCRFPPAVAMPFLQTCPFILRDASMRQLLLPAILALAVAVPASAQDDEARLLRLPPTPGHRVVFTSAGNLYTVPADGGIARRLTNHDGFEMFARF